MKREKPMQWFLMAMSLVFSSGLFAQAMYITPDGHVGLGTDLPISSLEVTRSDGTSQVLVNETSDTAAPRTLFQLRNPGNTKFGVFNTQADVDWAFANPGSGFRLSRQGSGEVQMEITNDGNLTIAGLRTELSYVNAKTNIVAVDAGQILRAVADLPVARQEYKDTPGEAHIGPMAQDFYAAFGLGSSDTGISTMDTSGVALAAIQALSAENAQLKVRLEALEQQQAQMQAVMVRMLEQQAEPRTVSATLN